MIVVRTTSVEQPVELIYLSEKATSQTNKVNQFILQHHIMNHLQKP